MSNQGKFDKRVERVLLKQFDKLSRRYSLADVKHACAKFVHVQRVRASVEKERRRLQARLAELERK